MRRFLSVTLVATLTALGGGAYAGQIWTDGNGDGLPDGSAIMVAPSTNVTVGVWFDAQAFAFTNFLAYIEWQGQCVSYVSASYVITGGSNFPIDNFSAPNATGFGGSGFPNRTGIVQVGNAVFHINTTTACCISPIIDIYNPYYVFSQLGAGSAYMLFTTNPRTCYNGDQDIQGACCFTDGSCQVLTAAACQAAGGVYQGDGTSCADVFCEGLPGTGACCLPDFSCQEISAAACEAAGGIYQGDGTNCAEANCQPIGACCLPSTDCFVMTEADCVALGGFYQGDATNCEIIPPCEPPGPTDGACCLPDGSCVILTGTECAATGGLYWGDGSGCVPDFCTRGACCLADATCLNDVVLEQCNQAGGLWYEGATCGDPGLICTEPDAVESRSWGNIKGLFR